MRNKRGFTLLEALVALAIVGIAGVAALAALGTELRTAERATKAFATTALAEDRVAAIALLGPDELSPLVDSLARGRFAPSLDGYRWEASVAAVPDERDLYDITVRVEGDGASHELRTRAYRPPPLPLVRAP